MTAFEVRVELAASMIRVLLAEDAEMIREALVSLLQREPDIEVVATAAGRPRGRASGR